MISNLKMLALVSLLHTVDASMKTTGFADTEPELYPNNFDEKMSDSYVVRIELWHDENFVVKGLALEYNDGVSSLRIGNFACTYTQ